MMDEPGKLEEGRRKPGETNKDLFSYYLMYKSNKV